MTIAYIVDTRTKNGESLGWFGKKDAAYIFETKAKAENAAKSVELLGHEAVVKTVAVFDVEEE